MKKMNVEDDIEERTPVRAVFSASGSDFDDTEEEVFESDASEEDTDEASEMEDTYSKEDAE